ncbi:hypothetical protein J2S71_000073 [Olsenella profusa DSM 13989]|nr:hypothetical protein [Olsenella profusa DSM 13989]
MIVMPRNSFLDDMRKAADPLEAASLIERYEYLVIQR